MIAHAFSASGPYAILVYAGIALCALGAARLAGMLRRVPERAGGALIVVGVIVAAVGGSLHEEPPDPSTRPVSPGRVEIRAPVDGAQLSAPEANVVVDVVDFDLLPLGETRDARPGFGHLHVMRDGLILDQGGGAETLVCIPAGRHTVSVVLVAEDHFGFRNEAELTDSISVEGVEGARC